MFRALARSASRAGLFGKPGLIRAMANRRRDEGAWTNAAALYREYLALRPADAPLWVQYGNMLKESGQFTEAEAAYRQSLSLRPEFADTHLQLGHALKLSGRMSAAGESFARCLQLDPANAGARQEIWYLVSRGLFHPHDPAFEESSKGREAAETTSVDERLDELTTVFDVTELITHFHGTRLPTGIQRVQIEMITALLRGPAFENEKIGVCAFSEKWNGWVRIPNALFLDLCALSLAGGGETAEPWVTAMRAVLKILYGSNAATDFAKGAALVAISSPLWFPNYFLYIRDAKARYDIRYVPFVHDLIPVLAPNYFVPELVREFSGWISSVLDHADHILVNSNATRADLFTVAEMLGRDLPRNSVTDIPLDAGFGSAGSEGQTVDLRKWSLKPGGYVLFVATIEPRKNHIAAFSAWLALIEKYGAKKIPKLICVGGKGWMNDAVHAQLASSAALRDRVMILSGVSDGELAALYDNCLFTLYPSHYEGWGLPITESLCRGKVALLSTAPSLREAGGAFADYFEIGSKQSFVAALEKLIFDDAYRAAREDHIRKDFRPESWLKIGIQAMRAAYQARGTASAEHGRLPFVADVGVYYAARRNRETGIWPGRMSGEVFRAGHNWSDLEDWGVWTKAGLAAEIAFRVRGPHRALRVYIGLIGLQKIDSAWSLDFGSPAKVQSLNGVIASGERKWISFEIPADMTDATTKVTLRGAESQDLAALGNHGDERLTSIGFRGFYLCDANDDRARADFLEAIVRDELSLLEPGVRNAGAVAAVARTAREA